MATYVPISRDDIEQWLATLASVGSKGWERVPSKAGLYLIHMSDQVSVLLSSSVGNADQAMEKDQGSMNLRLVARDNYARVLNKKATGQGKFYRTEGWRKTLAKGVAKLRDAYIDAKVFYDRLTEVKDTVAYRRDWLATIDAIPGSDKDTFLQDLRRKVDNGSLLSDKQEKAVRDNADRAKPVVPATPVPAAPAKPVVDQAQLARVDVVNTLMQSTFTQSLRKWVLDAKPLTTNQIAALERMEDQLRKWVANLGQQTKNTTDLQFLRDVYRSLRDGKTLPAEDVYRLKGLLQVGARTAATPVLMDIPRGA